MGHVQPVPVAVLGVNPAGSVSLTVTVVPLVGEVPLFVAVKVKLPVPARANVEALAVLAIVIAGPAAILTVTESEAALVSPPPLTLAELVSDAGALEATLTAIEIGG